MRRALGLVELLVVVAILGVLAAVLFPVFARSRERAKLTSCASRLRQLAVALNLYRVDHDGRGYIYTLRDDGMNHLRYPFNTYEGMSAYLGDGSVLWCPEPNAAPECCISNSYHYRASPRRREDLPGIRIYYPAHPVPGTVVAYCANHVKWSEYDPRYSHAELKIGTYPFVREDTSFGIVPNAALTVSYYEGAQWYEGYGAKRSWSLRFPGEPWPPEPEG